MNKILILEDEESVNRGIAFSVNKAGYEVVQCYTIKEGKTEFSKDKPWVVICDINLPDGSGLDFIKWVREQSDAYIICLTAMDNEMDQVMGYEVGADDYITKPFSLSVLLLKIEALMKRSQKKDKKDIIISGDIEFDRLGMKARVSHKELPLTKNEMKMLTMFLLHPKQILSKSQMLQYIFDMEGDFVDENTLAVNIRRLREKIEADPGSPQYIKNVRGIGYIWNKEVRYEK